MDFAIEEGKKEIIERLKPKFLSDFQKAIKESDMERLSFLLRIKNKAEMVWISLLDETSFSPLQYAIHLRNERVIFFFWKMISY